MSLTKGYSEQKTTRNPPENIRKKILFLYKVNQYLSRIDLFLTLGITEGNVRHHLCRPMISVPLFFKKSIID